MRVALALLLLASGAAAQPSPEASTPDSRRLWRAMETADIAAAGGIVADVIRDADLDLPDDLRWRTQPYDAPFNFYTPTEHIVSISDMPTEAQARTYWGAWSALLTGGAWDPVAHFSGGTEAVQMATYNQAVLAAHELGHALAYRYGVNPRTDDGNVNCQELLADRVAAAVMDHFARGDARFERLRRGYLRLIGTLNAGIDPQLRYLMPSREALLADCRAIQVLNPTQDPASLIPYASAFFERHRLLYGEATPEPLAVLADGLFRPQLRTLGPEAAPTGPLADVRTLASLREPASPSWLAEADISEDATLVGALLSTGSTVQSGAYALDPEGQPWLVSIQLLPNLFDTTVAQVSTHRADETDSGLAWTPLALPSLMPLASPESALAFGDSTFLALVQFASTSDLSVGSYRLLGIARGEHTWGPALDLSPGETYRLHHVPGGAVLASPEGLHIVDLDALALGAFNEDDSALDVLAFSPEALYVGDRTALGVQVFDGGAMTVEPGGTVLYRFRYADEAFHRVTGSGFASTRDGRDPDRVAFQTIIAARPLADGSLALIERLDTEGQAPSAMAGSPAPAARGSYVLRTVRYVEGSPD